MSELPFIKPAKQKIQKLPESVKKYFSLIEYAIETFPLVSSFDAGEKYSPQTHIAGLGKCKRHWLANPLESSSVKEGMDIEEFLSTLSALVFKFDAVSNTILMGPNGDLSRMSKNAMIVKSENYSSEIDTDVQTSDNIQALIYCLHNGLLKYPVLIRNPSTETREYIDNCLPLYPNVAMRPFKTLHILLI